MLRPVCLLCLLPLLSACDVIVVEDDLVDVAAFNAETARVNALDPTAVADLPTGTVDYVGQFGSDVVKDFVPDHAIVGDLEMRVGFDDNEIGGFLSNVVLIDPLGSQSEVAGLLTLDGAENSGDLVATATGDLDFEPGFVGGTSNMTLVLRGEVLDDAFVGDAVGGGIEGAGTGEVSVILDGNGSFYGIAD